MKLESISITNFRCFKDRATIDLSEGITALIGANGSGKTATLLALSRLFGVSEPQRRFVREDFHVPHDEEDAPFQRKAQVTAVITFPELTDGAEESLHGVPHFFHHMSASEDGKLKCCLTLEATWTNNNTTDGIIETEFWAHPVTENLETEMKQRVSAVDRASIQFIYVPATRDGESQVNSFLKGRLWKAVEWSSEVRETIEEAGSRIDSSFQRESAVSTMHNALSARWLEVNGAGTFSSPMFSIVEPSFESMIKSIDISFAPDEEGKTAELRRLSDGQRSLFHISMAAAALDIEAELGADQGDLGFQRAELDLPALTILAIEEPENCLSPFYISRVIDQLKDLGARSFAQTLVSSHSASLLGRISPDDVRYFRLDLKTLTSRVKPIPLPSREDEAGKYIREAVKSFPELYFASFVVLGEGDSEEIVIPKIAETLGLKLDPSFVAVVPLGGRHVNHFWKLLNDLEIPHATLLDLDWGRYGGGWGRIKNICEKLLGFGANPEDLFFDGKGLTIKENLERIEDQCNFNDDLNPWIRHLYNYNVFFMCPLDLDFSMLQAFPESYKVLEEGANGPQDDPESAKTTVLKKNGEPNLYGQISDNDFVWYRYLFLGRGKPITHLRALSRTDGTVIAQKVPYVIRLLLDTVIRDISPHSRVKK